MAKEYEVKCPYCQNVRKMRISDLMGQLTEASGLRGADDKKTNSTSPESLNEANWIDFKKPCPNCGHTFSFNYVTGDSRE